MAKRVIALWSATGLLAALAGCADSPSAPDLDRIYANVAVAENPGRRPLITVPGTLGSRLVDGETGTVIWGGGSRGLSADPEDPVEARLMALPILPPEAPLSDIRDGIVAAGVIDVARARVLGVPIDVNVYGGVLETLAKGGFQNGKGHSQFARPGRGGEGDSAIAAFGPEAAADGDLVVPRADVSALGYGADGIDPVTEEPANAFRFAYDWRRDIPSLAVEFDAFIRERKREVAAIRSVGRAQPVGPEDVRFDLLAHSMGGLVARYYLMYGTAPLPEDGRLPPITWAGAQHFSRVIFVASPNAGSILAVDNLVNDKSLGPFQPVFPGAMLATHPSAWQLFPRARHRRLTEGAPDGLPLDPLDPELWERHGWGLLGPDADEFLSWVLPGVPDPAERRRIAGAHQARLMHRARAFQRAMDRWAPEPPGLETFLVVGGGYRTPAGAVVDPLDGTLDLAGVEEGDGVVLRASVLLDERQGDPRPAALRTPLRFDTTLFLPDEHVELTRNPVFGDNLLFWLLEQPRDLEELARPRAAGVLGMTGGEPEPAVEPALAPVAVPIVPARRHAGPGQGR